MLVDAFKGEKQTDTQLFTHAFHFCRNMMNSSYYLMLQNSQKYDILSNMRKNCFLLMCSDIQSGTDTSKPTSDSTPKPTSEPPLKPGSLSPENSLQQMIEYYSQDGGDGSDGGPTTDEKTRFKALNIEKDPIMDWELPYGENQVHVTYLDKRFCAGIHSNGNNTCFFVTALQYLMLSLIHI